MWADWIGMRDTIEEEKRYELANHNIVNSNNNNNKDNDTSITPEETRRYQHLQRQRFLRAAWANQKECDVSYWNRVG